MTLARRLCHAVAIGSLLLAGACARGSGGDAGNASEAVAGKIAVTIKSANGTHVFTVDPAKTAKQQEDGLMFRTGIPKDGGMLFWPYPADGGGPREANFWMKNTPSPLDIIFIRPDGTIAHIAENTVPFSEQPIPSGAPVNAVLEINGGVASELGIAEGDAVSWAGR